MKIHADDRPQARSTAGWPPPPNDPEPRALPVAPVIHTYSYICGAPFGCGSTLSWEMPGGTARSLGLNGQVSEHLLIIHVVVLP